jgi:transposase
VVAAPSGDWFGGTSKMGGHRKPVLEPHRAFIKQRISQTPHLTLHKLKDELAARGVEVSHNAVWMFLRREGLRFKKHYSPLSRRALTLRAGVAAGGRGRPAWIPSARLYRRGLD